MDLELQDKCALVTGGSRGIGRAIALELALEGCDVAIAARNPGPLEGAAEEIARVSGRRVIPVTVDTRDDASVRAMVDRAASELGSIDILVNCAAQPGGPTPIPVLATLTQEQLDEEMHTKVMGYIRCARDAAPIMEAKGWGRIINVSGLAARQSGSILGSVRNVSVAALTKNLADELGPKGINVTVVHPGATRTERTAEVIERRAEESGRTSEEVERAMAEGNSIHHLVDAAEVAYVVAFLASPKSIAINGDAVAVGGGLGRAIHY